MRRAERACSLIGGDVCEPLHLMYRLWCLGELHQMAYCIGRLVITLERVPKEIVFRSLSLSLQSVLTVVAPSPRSQTLLAVIAVDSQS